MKTPRWLRTIRRTRFALLAYIWAAYIWVGLVANAIAALTRSEWGRGASVLALAVIAAVPPLGALWYIARNPHPTSHMGTIEPGNDLLMNANDTQWYWCLDHNAAEPADSPCPPDRRWGPYPTREAAEHWKEKVEARNEEWDAADKEWEEG